MTGGGRLILGRYRGVGVRSRAPNDLTILIIDFSVIENRALWMESSSCRKNVSKLWDMIRVVYTNKQHTC